MTEPDLSVIVVNYNVGPFLLGAVRSLLDQRFSGPDGRDGRLDIIVIDNASGPADAPCLAALQPAVTLIANDRNLGFAVAVNQGIERSRGRYLCILNPDARLMNGAIDALLAYLYRDPAVGAVGPRIWVDEGRTLLLPPEPLPTLGSLIRSVLGRVQRGREDRRSRRRTGRTLDLWRAKEPVPVDMIPGTCLVASRRVFERIGGFDPCYFLYYEDAEWCRRLQRSGYRLAWVPSAELLHYYNQSAKQDRAAAGAHAARSEARYVQQRYGWAGTALYRLARARAAQRLPDRPGAGLPEPLIELGHLEGPPHLLLPGGSGSSERLIEVSDDSAFHRAAVSVVTGDTFRFPADVWARMAPGRYYARCTDPHSGSRRTYLSWIKAA